LLTDFMNEDFKDNSRASWPEPSVGRAYAQSSRELRHLAVLMPLGCLKKLTMKP